MVWRGYRFTIAPDDGRLARYIVTDPFVAFWFRFVQPSEAALERGRDDWVLDQRILPELDRFVSRAEGPWERACRDYLWRELGAGQLGSTGFDRLGPWWEGRATKGDSNREVDNVGLDGSRVTLVGSCKWRNDYMKLGDLFELQAAATRLGATATTAYILFSRSGFDPALVAHTTGTGVRLVTTDDMFPQAMLI